MPPAVSPLPALTFLLSWTCATIQKRFFQMHIRLRNLQGLSVHCRLPSVGLLCYTGGICHFSVDTYRERVCNCIGQPCPFSWAPRGTMRWYDDISVYRWPLLVQTCFRVFPSFLRPSLSIKLPPSVCTQNPLQSSWKRFQSLPSKEGRNYHLEKNNVGFKLKEVNPKEQLHFTLIMHTCTACKFLSETPLHASEIKWF